MDFGGGKPINVLFFSNADSSRSIMAAALMNRLARGRFTAFSAGADPAGAVHPEAAKLLAGLGYNLENMRSKSWSDLAQSGAPEMDLVVSLYDAERNETAPTLPTQPITVRWSMADPAKVRGDDKQVALAFADTYRQLANWIDLLAQLPFDRLDRQALHARLGAIGQD